MEFMKKTNPLIYNYKIAPKKIVAVFVGGVSIDVTLIEREDGTYPEFPNKKSLGGKGANQITAFIRALKSMNGDYAVEVDAYLIANIGDDEHTAFILSELKKNGVNTTYVNVKPGVKNDCAIIKVDREGNNHISRQGNAIETFSADLVESNEEILATADVIVSQYKAPQDCLDAIIDFSWMYKKTLYVTACRPKRLVLSEDGNMDRFNKMSMLFCNEEEAKTVFETDDLKSVVEKYPTKVVITLGAKGALYGNGRKVVEIPGLVPMNGVEDTTGAGDNLCGYAIAGICMNIAPEYAIRRGVVASTIKVERVGAQNMPYMDETDELANLLYLGAKYQMALKANGNITGFFG